MPEDSSAAIITTNAINAKNNVPKTIFPRLPVVKKP